MGIFVVAVILGGVGLGGGWEGDAPYAPGPLVTRAFSWAFPERI